MLLRVVLLFALVKVIDLFQDSLFTTHIDRIIDGDFNLHAIVVLFGGVFIIYTATREIMHILIMEDLHAETRAKSSFASMLTMIIVMNAVFSFDSILSAMALTDVFLVMATAIIIGGLLMIWLADRVSSFLEKNRMYEVIGLFILYYCRHYAAQRGRTSGAP